MNVLDQAVAQLRTIDPCGELEFRNNFEVATRALEPLHVGDLEKAAGIALDVLGKRLCVEGLAKINDRSIARAERDAGHDLVDTGIALEKAATAWTARGLSLSQAHAHGRRAA